MATSFSILTCLAATGANAEGQLYDAALFAPAQQLSLSPSQSLPTFDTGLHPPHANLALEYLSIAKELRTKTPLSAVKGHLSKLMRPGLGWETDLREKLGRIWSNGALGAHVELAREMKRWMDVRHFCYSWLRRLTGAGEMDTDERFRKARDSLKERRAPQLSPTLADGVMTGEMAADL